MAKQKKKRNKAYTGVDASTTKPSITRIHAVKRNPASQWWLEKKRFAKPLLITAAVAIVIIWLLFELVRIIGS